MLIKIIHQGQSHLIESEGRITWGTSSSKQVKVRFHPLNDTDRLIFQQREPFTRLEDDHVWNEFEPDLIFIDLEELGRYGKERYPNWARFVDAGDHIEKTIVFDQAYIMNDSGKTIENIRP